MVQQGLESGALGRWLIRTRVAALVLGLLRPVLLTLYWPTFVKHRQFLPPFLGQALNTVTTLLGLVVMVTSILWVYELHKDLRMRFPDYRISPGYALALYLIPVYNIWGYWAMWNVAAEYIPGPVHLGRVRLPGISSLVTFIYISGAISLVAALIVASAEVAGGFLTTTWLLTLFSLAESIATCLLYYAVIVGLEQQQPEGH